MQPGKHLQFIMLATVSLLLISTSEAAAQAVQMKVRVAGRAAGGFGQDRHSTTDPKQMALLLEMRIEQMQSVCKLSDAQTKKLALVGKSAARKLLSRDGRQINIGGLFGGGNPLEVKKDSLSDEDSEPQESTDKPKNGMNMKIPTSLNEVTKQPLWKKAIKSVLSEEQREQWTNFTAERNNRTRELVVNHRVAGLEQQLCLRPDQIAAVQKIVERVEADQLVKKFNSGEDDMMQMIMPGGDHAVVSEDDLQDVLTAVQLKVWKSRSRSGAIPGFLANVLGGKPDDDDDESYEGDFGVEFDSGGLEVKSVTEKSLAASFGIQVGDLIDSVGGEPVDTSLQFQTAISKAGKKFSVTVLRNNAEVRLEKK